MRLPGIMATGIAVVMALVVFPDTAWGWTPGTHIYLAESVLANLTRLPGWVAEVVRTFPYDFLYGNIAADTSMAKKYVPVGRHCHSWNVGGEIYRLADNDPLRSFALGYLSHLAADTVAHNFFVPRQLVVTSRSISLGHSYWESRFEAHLGESYARTAMDVIREDHYGADAHLDRILSPTIFSVRTSRRLFRGMVGLTETSSWQRTFRALAEHSKWDLPDDAMERYMATSFQFIMDTLAHEANAARQLDPAGETSLRLAKRMRLDVLRHRIAGTGGSLEEMADEHFALPDYGTTFWSASQPHRPWRERQANTNGHGGEI